MITPIATRREHPSWRAGCKAASCARVTPETLPAAAGSLSGICDAATNTLPTMITWRSRTRASARAGCLWSALAVTGLLASCGGTASPTAGRTTTGSTGHWRAITDSGPYAASIPSCVSASACLAVAGNVIIRTDDGGSSWVVSLKTGSSPGIALSDISCTAPECVAVGVGGPTRQPKAFVTGDLGRSWRSVNLAVPAGANEVSVAGVSCGTPDSCLAVGDDNGGVLAWSTSDGGHTWTNLILSDTFGSPSAVACTTADFCVVAAAQGLLVTTSGPTGFAFAHTPASWVSIGASLNAITCVPGTRSCMVVGSAGECLVGGQCSPAVATSAGGSSWSSTSNLPTGIGWLSAVSCVAPGNCVAGGYLPGKSQTVNGPPGATFLIATKSSPADWKTIPLPEPASGSFEGLAGISCATESFCLAGGLTSGPVSAVKHKSYALIGPP